MHFICTTLSRTLYSVYLVAFMVTSLFILCFCLLLEQRSETRDEPESNSLSGVPTLGGKIAKFDSE